eukprot:gene10991-7635_t
MLRRMYSTAVAAASVPVCADYHCSSNTSTSTRLRGADHRTALLHVRQITTSAAATTTGTAAGTAASPFVCCVAFTAMRALRRTTPLLQRVGYRPPTVEEIAQLAKAAEEEAEGAPASHEGAMGDPSAAEPRTLAMEADLPPATTIDWVAAPPPPSLLRRPTRTQSGAAAATTHTSPEAEATGLPLQLLQPTEREAFVRALVKQKMGEKNRQRQCTAEASGTAPPLVLPAELEREAAECRYQAQLEVQWVEDWAVSRPLTPGPGGAAQEETVARRRMAKRALLERIDLQKPLPYILGSQLFYGCILRCRPPVLCPKEETQAWVHWLVQSQLQPGLKGTPTEKREGTTTSMADVRVLDMCCGTGCIGVALAKQLYPRCAVVAVDVEPAAVELAASNAEANGLSLVQKGDLQSAAPAGGKGLYQALHGDLFAPFTTTTATRNAKGLEEEPQLSAAWAESFDLIVCSPPYLLPDEYEAIPAQERFWMPRLAVLGDPERDGPQQYRYFKELCEVGWRLLKPRQQRHAGLRNCPNLVLEVGRQAELVASMLERSGNGHRWKDVAIHLDSNDLPRWISANSGH